MDLDITRNSTSHLIDNASIIQRIGFEPPEELRRYSLEPTFYKDLAPGYPSIPSQDPESGEIKDEQVQREYMEYINYHPMLLYYMLDTDQAELIARSLAWYLFKRFRQVFGQFTSGDKMKNEIWRMFFSHRIAAGKDPKKAAGPYASSSPAALQLQKTVNEASYYFKILEDWVNKRDSEGKRFVAMDMNKSYEQALQASKRRKKKSAIIKGLETNGSTDGSANASCGQNRNAVELGFSYGNGDNKYESERAKSTALSAGILDRHKKMMKLLNSLSDYTESNHSAVVELRGELNEMLSQIQQLQFQSHELCENIRMDRFRHKSMLDSLYHQLRQSLDDSE